MNKCIKPYTELNTQKRIDTENNGQKDENTLYKLLSNAVYGKVMENLKKRIDVKLVKAKLYFTRSIWQ